MNVTLIACFSGFDNMICWLDYCVYRILMKVNQMSYFRNTLLLFFLLDSSWCEYPYPA